MTDQAADWSLLDAPGVLDVLGKVARKVSTDYEYVEYEDAYQDGALMLATQTSLREVVDNLGLLYHGLWCDLVNRYATEGTRRAKLDSYEALMEARE